MVGNAYTPPNIPEEEIKTAQKIVHHIFSFPDDLSKHYYRNDLSGTTDQNPLLCMYLGENAFSLKTFITPKTEVRIELVSMDGQSKTIFNELVEEGEMQTTFFAPKGLFSVRLTAKNQFSKIIKIINP